MGTRIFWILLVAGVLTASTRAQTPTYLVTGGEAHFEGFNTLELFWSFSGPDIAISGVIESPAPGPIGPVPITDGAIFAAVNVSQIFSDAFFASGTVGGIYYPTLSLVGTEDVGNVSINGSALLPNPPITTANPFQVDVTGPATFSGTLLGCAPFNECSFGGGKDIFQLSIDGTGLANFTLSGPTSPGFYNVSNESFTLTKVTAVTPEPASYVLFATGLLVFASLAYWKKIHFLSI